MMMGDGKLPLAVSADPRIAGARAASTELGAPAVHIIEEEAGLRALLEGESGALSIAIHGYASMGEFLETYDGSRPGCALLHLPLADMSPEEALRRLAQNNIKLPTMVLAEQADVATVVQCMKLGAFDFMEIPVESERLRHRVEDLIVDDVERAREDAALSAASMRFVALSPRERQILDQIVHGAGSKEIARLLGISSKTVDVHRTNLMRKVGVASVAQLINLALSVRHGRFDTPLKFSFR